ncbi:gamma-glutamyltransferase family protein [Alkalilimnicola ehrlichii MLHE-1]|uniref:Gamma-glutamyltransferase 2 n=1 Tax=Alkalilimnicola ehrlichii (strain ATCC BAA-1101 / DSM 17681 / MLHE-1) TaxID=187272 RepID=Q0A6Z8_ALKEH|nr:gamma-glutamyltransferase [Alkalilimnicola ehrlichii]ABI57389.1 gamma-glutamyltransferase 2 [Alkalilimnicola ehrlichii MLHE-1]
MLANDTPLRAAVSAPHHLAAEAGAGVLREGGNAIEAMVAAAAAIAVVYPHMNGLGGDSFWLLREPGRAPLGIEACGPAAVGATPAWYRDRGLTVIPSRGGAAANTVAGTVAGWQVALALSRSQWSGRLPLHRLLAPAVAHAREGYPMTHSQAEATRDKHPELGPQPGFDAQYLPGGAFPVPGETFRQPELASTLERLAAVGLADFYSGELAQALGEGLAEAGSPIRAPDLAGYAARRVAPLNMRHSLGTLWNMPPPTQGLASLMILGVFDRLQRRHPVAAESAEWLHAMVEAVKQAFLVRDRVVTDPAYLPEDPAQWLKPEALDALADRVDWSRALAWPQPASPGDTVWLGAIDAEGRCVSFIQSLFHEFGSGVVVPDTGVIWQNRGCSFSLAPDALNDLKPGRRPFHTLNPALAVLDDGRTLVYGTMGGEGQPQTQAAVFTRVALYGQSPEQAVASPRWLLGRTWGAGTDTLKLEADFPPELVEALRGRGHDVEVVPPRNSAMGHAGLLVRDRAGHVRAASDPRSDGGVAGL